MITKPKSFSIRLNEKLVKYKNPLCIGIDPHPDLMHDIFGGSEQNPSSSSALKNLEYFCTEVIYASNNKVSAVKPQVALFERFGYQGLKVLSKISNLARSLNLLVIMDAKRGDIGSTSKAYAEAWLGSDAPFPSDALTLNPYLGLDSLQPFIEISQKTNSGLFILTRTSNPGSLDFQQLLFEKEFLWEKVAKSISTKVSENESKVGKSNQKLSSIGIVVGATGSKEPKKLRKILPNAPFLVPGFGAQGGSAFNALKGIVRKDKSLVGLINSSRNITHSSELDNSKNIKEWRNNLNKVIKKNITEIKDAIKNNEF